MTIDEHINKAEGDAKRAELQANWGIGTYFMDRTEALEYAKECRQLAEWLKDYKRLLEQEPVLAKIRAEIKEWYWQADKQALAKDPCVVDAMVDLFIRTIDKYKAKSEGHMNCEDCDYTDIADWEQDKTTGKAKAVYWCERYKELCSNISECHYKTESEDKK